MGVGGIGVDVGGTVQSSDIVGYQSYGRAYSSASGTAYSVGNTTYVNASGSASSAHSAIPAVHRLQPLMSPAPESPPAPPLPASLS